MCCHNGSVEDEFHFLMLCPIYDDLRGILFNVGKSILKVQDNAIIDPSFDLKAFFVNIMKSTDSELVLALSNFLWNAFKRREEIMSRRV